MTQAFTDAVLAAEAPLWQAAVKHRFARELARMDGGMPAFRRYLVYEHALVLEAIDLLARAVAGAPSLGEKRWLAEALRGLVGGQIDYFDTAFARLDLAPAERSDLPSSVSACLSAMRRTGTSGAYPEMLAVMFAGEWLYWTWCSAISAEDAADPDAAGWIGLHADENFRDHAVRLKTHIDALAEHQGAEGRRHLSGVIAATLRREIAFHDAVFAG